jgi:hypothetical protein
MIEKDKKPPVDYVQKGFVFVTMLDAVAQRVSIDELPGFISQNQGKVKTFFKNRKHRKVS